MGGVVYRDTVVLVVGRLVAEYQCTYPVSLSLALPAVAFWSRRERPLKGCRLFYLMACLCRCCEACSRYLFRLGNFETREDASENGINFAPFPRRPFFPLFLRRVLFRVFFFASSLFLISSYFGRAADIGECESSNWRVTRYSRRLGADIR